MRWLKVGMCGLWLIVGSKVAFAGPQEDIKALLEKGDARAAYELGRKNPDLLGNPAFDFYFGIAAIDGGHAGEGVLALERYAVNFPNNLNGRLELARGYFVLGDDQRAREEFTEVLKANPPAPVKANIARFMEAMRSRESAYRTKLGAFLEAGYGYDTNANGGVNSPDINLPVFGDVTIGQAGVHAETSYEWLAAGGQISHPLAPGLAIFASGRVDGKFHRTAQQFDQNSLGASGGLSYVKNKNLYRATASYSRVAVDDVRFRNIQDISGEWLHQLNELQTISVFGQYAKLRYDGSNEPRDANFGALGVGFRKAFIGGWQPQLNANINVGREHDIRNRPDLGRDTYGGRVALTLAPASKWTLSTGGNYQGSRYRGEDTLLLTRRQDRYYAIDSVASYAWTPRLSLRGELLLSLNDSNLALYEYQRGIATFKVRYEFK